jgi:S-adenosylmethionine decarboxylase
LQLAPTIELDPLRLRLWTLDARVAEPAVLTDAPRLRAVLRAAAERGGATILGEEFCEFGNGAVTGVLVLAQSHLSIHTWPERALANVDLLSCGSIDGEAIVFEVAERIGAEQTRVTCRARTVW